jgi:hypothetical protein
LSVKVQGENVERGESVVRLWGSGLLEQWRVRVLCRGVGLAGALQIYEKVELGLESTVRGGVKTSGGKN